ncbi:MAG: hypothetical protein AAF542_08425 [Pseudomonadota bacterium]
MNRMVRNVAHLIAALCFVGGVADVLIQYFEAVEIHWRVPIILMGIGFGLPLVIFPFQSADTPQDSEEVTSEEDYSNHFPEGGGFLSSFSDGSAGESGESDIGYVPDDDSIDD